MPFVLLAAIDRATADGSAVDDSDVLSPKAPSCGIRKDGTGLAVRLKKSATEKVAWRSAA